MRVCFYSLSHRNGTYSTHSILHKFNKTVSVINRKQPSSIIDSLLNDSVSTESYNTNTLPLAEIMWAGAMVSYLKSHSYSL
jgi:hypothetical protein